jgi:predicted ArsR family transcriptional regulator
MNQETIAAINFTRLQEFTARANELDALQREFGPAVSDIVLRTRAEAIEQEWRAIAKTLPANGNDGLLGTLWKWVGEAGFEFTHEKQGRVMRMRVTKCPIADMAIKIGKQDWGFKCYCCDDPSIVRGYNDQMKFTRTKTLMEGHDCCDHTYEE